MGLQMETPCSPSGVVNERLQAAPSSRPAKTDKGKTKNGWRNDVPRADECAVCNTTSTVVLRPPLGLLLTSGSCCAMTTGPDKGFSESAEKGAKVASSVRRNIRGSRPLSFDCRFGLQTDVRIGDLVTTVADKLPMRSVPGGHRRCDWDAVQQRHGVPVC